MRPCRPSLVALAFVVTFLAVLALAMIYRGAASSQANCDPGSWYDPTHQVCAPYPPAYPPNNYPPPTNYPYPPTRGSKEHGEVISDYKLGETG